MKNRLGNTIQEEEDNEVEIDVEKEVEVEKHANALPDIAGMESFCSERYFERHLHLSY